MPRILRTWAACVGAIAVGTAAVFACVGDDPPVNVAGDASLPPGADVSSTNPPADAAFEAPPGCSSRTSDEANGVFVLGTSASADNDQCGSRLQPCRTIGFGISRATTSGKKTVYVGSGTYTEALTLTSDVAIEGAWFVTVVSPTEVKWEPICTANLFEAVTIAAPTGNNVGVRATAGNSTLRLLTVSTKPGGLAAGQSLYGIVASNVGTRVTLDNVIVDVGAGATGATGTKGADGGTTFGTCAANDGGVGATGVAGDASSSVSVGPSGITITNTGVSGGGAGIGNNGTVAPAPPSRDDCVATCGSRPSCTFTTTTLTGGMGVPGCGGKPSGGGGPGGAGGSSIGVFVWQAAVEVVGGAVRGGPGGTGGNGGPGGGPGLGSAGQAGSLPRTAT
jgi:hypothetical protein